MLSLAEFESRCTGKISGEITPADVLHAYKLVQDLAEKYRLRLEEKLNAWTMKRTKIKTGSFICGIEKSLPNGDRIN